MKETGEMIGDCGLTMQLIKGQRDWTFYNTPFNIVYSYMKYTNEASAKTAMSYGCKQVDEFSDEINEITKVFAISRNEWINR